VWNVALRLHNQCSGLISSHKHLYAMMIIDLPFLKPLQQSSVLPAVYVHASVRALSLRIVVDMVRVSRYRRGPYQ